MIILPTDIVSVSVDEVYYHEDSTGFRGVFRQNGYTDQTASLKAD